MTKEGAYSTWLGKRFSHVLTQEDKKNGSEKRQWLAHGI